jgi:hypothetical protein
VRPSPPLCDTMRQGQCQSRDTVPPTLVRPTRCALKRGRRNPRRGDGRLFHACPGLCRDVRPAGPVTSIAIGPVRPSPPPQRHTTSRQLHPRVSVQTTTQQKISTPPPSKPLLDGQRARHDAPLKARFARTAVHSVALSAMPSHVARTMRHACKLPPPWLIKGGAVPWP